MWRSKNGDLMVCSGPDSDGHALAGVEHPEHITCFSYGVCVIRSGHDYHVLRFDGEPAPAMEPDRKASAVARCGAGACG